jgi:hypothetical protein
MSQDFNFTHQGFMRAAAAPAVAVLGVCVFVSLVACSTTRSPAGALPATTPGAAARQPEAETGATSTSSGGKASGIEHGGHGVTADSANDSFDALMQRAMARMDEGMNVACTHQPDVDFAAMMVPHHQGAVDMALVELRYGKDERLRRLAEGIIVEQRQEIALMESILTELRVQ